MPVFAYCSGCKEWHDAGNAMLSPCPGCKQTVIIPMLPPAEKKTGNYLICGKCRKSIFELRSDVAEYRCEKCNDVTRIAGVSAQRLATLADFGTVVMNFNQRELIQTHIGADRAAKAGVAGGACHGICLQWVRRVLLSRKTDAQKFAYRDDKMPKKVQDGVKTQLIRRINAQWEGVAAQTDQIIKHKHDHKAMADLDRFEDASESPVTVAAYANAVCSRGSFAVGYCALIGCAAAPGASGHTVAVVKCPSDKYYLFDPNYGVYDVTSTAKLASAIHWVFCVDTTGLQATDGACAGNYELFRKRV